MRKDRSLFYFAVFTAVITLVLLGIGGMVTSHGAGMAVPDWPTSYGYNMFAFPFSYWIGGVFYEHSHRLVASFVGLLTVFLTRWVAGHPSRRWLAIIGGLELGAGLLFPMVFPSQRGTGHFLAGIGGVVLLASAIWARNSPAPRPLPALAWLAFWGVQLQGLLGGLRVVLFKDEIGILHAGLAQLFFIVICVIALMTSPAWAKPVRAPANVSLARWVWVATGLTFCQLLIGAGMRHAHAGLAIPDFPLAYGKVWPRTDAEAVSSYNRQRIEVVAAKPITAAHVNLQMVHRLNAYLILGIVATAAWRAAMTRGNNSFHAKMTFTWLGLILIQAALGAATIWSNKAADVATAHLVFGALSLAYGAISCIILLRPLVPIGNLTKPVQQSGTKALGDCSIARRAT